MQSVKLWKGLDCGIISTLYHIIWFFLGWWGYFNVIMNEDEKIRGLLVYLIEYEDFTFCINFCHLFISIIKEVHSLVRMKNI